jgi:glycogen debranching enzyme
MDEVVIKEQGTFLTTNVQGEIPEGPGIVGLFYQDTRFLSRFELRVNGAGAPLLHVEDRGYAATLIHGQIAEAGRDGSSESPFPPGLLVARTRYIAPSGTRIEGGTPGPGACRERITLTSFGREPREVTVTLALAADFKDIFVVRGFFPMQPGTSDEPRVPEPGLLLLAYTGRDGLRRQTSCRFAPAPERIVLDTRNPQERRGSAGPGATAIYTLRLAPRQPVALDLTIQPASGGAPVHQPADFAAGLTALAAAHREWAMDECTQIETDHPTFNAVVRQSLHDLRLLLEEHATGAYIAAGLPMFAVPFGRDGLIVAIQTLMVNPRIAVGTLRYLAAHQGQREDPTRDEEPGKIMHEMRSGEAVRTGAAPFGPYYGTVDATPLFLVLLGRALRWLDDAALAREFEPA